MPLKKLFKVNHLIKGTGHCKASHIQLLANQMLEFCFLGMTKL